MSFLFLELSGMAWTSAYRRARASSVLLFSFLISMLAFCGALIMSVDSRPPSHCSYNVERNRFFINKKSCHGTHLHLEVIGLVSRVFIQGGSWGVSHPSGKILSIPPSDTCPRFWTKACPTPQPRFVHENLKTLNTFFCQIWLLLSSQAP